MRISLSLSVAAAVLLALGSVGCTELTNAGEITIVKDPPKPPPAPPAPAAAAVNAARGKAPARPPGSG